MPQPDEFFVRTEVARVLALRVGLEYEFDYNNAARVVVSTVLGEVPYVGTLLSALIEIFWPDEKVDVWAEIADRVEALIDKKISAEVMQDVQDALTGLHNVIDDYVFAAKNFKDDGKYISEKFNVAQGHFLHDLPRFQSKGYEVLLLPLFAQFANLHLGLLRDGAAFGRTWGWSDTIVSDMRQRLADGIRSYGEYADKTYGAGYDDTMKKAPVDPRRVEPFNTVNRYVRNMTLTVMDFRNLWQYFDIARYPEPPKIYLDREIYSEAVGTAYDSRFYIPTPPKQPIRQVTVWGWDRIDAVQVDYPEQGGPDGVTSTGRMGNRGGGSNQPPAGGTFDLSKNPITTVETLSGDILNALSFKFADGSSTGRMGGRYPGGGASTFSYPAQMLSSIKIMGVSRYYGSADCAVFGFKFNPNAAPPVHAYARLYCTSPQEMTADEFIAGLRVPADVAELLREAAQREQWQGQRHWHWARVQVRMAGR